MTKKGGEMKQKNFRFFSPRFLLFFHALLAGRLEEASQYTI